MGVIEQIDLRLGKIEEMLVDMANEPPGDMPQTDQGPEYLSTIQAADFLGVSKQSLALWRSDAKGPAFVRIGNVVRYTKNDLREWMTEHRQEARAK